jgi:predicted nucleic acid-binding protein
VAVVVFDSDVLIGFLNATDAHHDETVTIVREAFAPRTQRWLSVVNYSEIMVGPLKAGDQTREHVESMLAHLVIELAPIDRKRARHAANVRARTGLKLPDAYAVALAVEARATDTDVRLASFDQAVLRAHAELSAG